MACSRLARWGRLQPAEGFSPTFFGFAFVRHHAAKPENLGRPRRSRLKPAAD